MFKKILLSLCLLLLPVSSQASNFFHIAGIASSGGTAGGGVGELRIAVGASRGDFLYFFDASGNLLDNPIAEGDRPVDDVAYVSFSPNGRYLAISESIPSTSNNYIKVYDIENNWSLEFNAFHSSTSRARGFEWATDSSYVLLQTSSSSLHSISTSSWVESDVGASPYVSSNDCMDLTSDDSLLMVGYDLSDYVAIYDVPTWTIVSSGSRPYWDGGSLYFSVDYNSDDSKVAIANYHGVRVYDTSTWTYVEVNTDDSYWVRWSDDDSILFTHSASAYTYNAYNTSTWALSYSETNSTYYTTQYDKGFAYDEGLGIIAAVRNNVTGPIFALLLDSSDFSIITTLPIDDVSFQHAYAVDIRNIP